ncbi:hypothetical protein [Mucilaginibacter sp.]
MKDLINALGFCPMKEITIVNRTRKAASKARYLIPFFASCAPSCEKVDHLPGATAIQEMLEPER